ncbi:hypothetical protein Asi02nite_39440 [Asanoa siamensis]|uniref:Uncharacterized protein n=1 Tax=Asanoa siamensis TaxID=926357 RepID=A0ABQ4CT13_9ACTN|nr:hypothetical protein Asi02nite_39440 [Asanoa siamensis]
MGWTGIAGHIAVLFLYVVSGLAVPAWAVGVLLVIWAALLALAITLLRARPLWTPAVPVAAVAIWARGPLGRRCLARLDRVAPTSSGGRTRP